MGDRLRRSPRNAAQVELAGTVLARRAGQEPPPIEHWEQLLEADQAVRGDREPGPGQPVGALVPFVLEVHRPVTVEEDRPGRGPLPPLPPYVRRAHDQELGRVVERASAGHSSMAVLIGGSSTGKTRACGEAIQSATEPGWRLWHPSTRSGPKPRWLTWAVVGPWTVIWLNETQLYLNTPGRCRERIAAALTTLLTDPAAHPVLAWALLWHEALGHLDPRGQPHRQAPRRAGRVPVIWMSRTSFKRPGRWRDLRPRRGLWIRGWPPQPWRQRRAAPPSSWPRFRN